LSKSSKTTTDFLISETRLDGVTFNDSNAIMMGWSVPAAAVSHRDQPFCRLGVSGSAATGFEAFFKAVERTAGLFAGAFFGAAFGFGTTFLGCSGESFFGTAAVAGCRILQASSA
jgi:hypothetical protein